MIEIWHNSRCSKSRAAYNYLKENNYKFRVKEYLKEPPTKEELLDVLNKLNKTPSEIIREKETLYKELNLKDSSQEELIEAMIKYPKLIERPIIINNNRACIARPLENIKKVV